MAISSSKFRGFVNNFILIKKNGCVQILKLNYLKFHWMKTFLCQNIYDHPKLFQIKYSSIHPHNPNHYNHHQNFNYKIHSPIV